MAFQRLSNLRNNSGKYKKVAIPLVIVIGGFLMLKIMGSMAPKPHKKPNIKRVPIVDTVQLSVENTRFNIESQGSIVPRTETTLVSEVSGQIKHVSDKFVVGGFFKKGEQLLEIDPISYEVALLQAQARLDGANARLVEEKARGKQAEKEWSLTGRNKNNAPILALRKPQLQQAIADVKAAEADVKSAQIKLQRTQIKAPYDAMLKAKMVDVGQYVTTGSQLASTFAVDYAEVRLPIKEQDFAYLDIPALGQSKGVGSDVELTINQSGHVQTLTTHITRSEGVVDATSRVNYVVAQIDDPYGLLRDRRADDDMAAFEPVRMGSFVKAVITGKEVADVIAIPRKAVRDSNKIYLVGAQRKLNIAEVDTLRSDNEFIYVSQKQGNKLIDVEQQVVLTKIPTAIEDMALRLPGDPEPEQVAKTETDTNDKQQKNDSSSDENKEKTTDSGKDKAIVKEGGSL